ncbi:MAG: NIPSNAP family protein [Pseudomonadales bacterium]|jgi:hypothetical protein|nr:NIPSNAP family protein [Pseudomonadales bacterium]MDP6472369.1 NIPSNAP family protein [Pseudomonadales bacterium]MDP6828165.1 NIPSNAP family protein [Pseudomonadales bacterium]MDP6973450.1 NIPSNAP family protein [Pseudomonadales bacterium]|tara:strand:- start:1141 stop:1533 length:393 start_codon:yes stop_codon:yes gene_type:complete
MKLLRALAVLFGTWIALSAGTVAAEVHELRIYTANEGKFEALHERFRDHTMALLEKHGMRNVAYWVDVQTPNTLVYIIAHESAGVIESNWKAFFDDPAWQAAYQASIAEGALVANIDKRFLSATDYSPAR